jgi:AcrR family transcriptional regulator
MPVSGAAVERTQEASVTRRTILAAAEELLARGGEEELSIRALCARVGVTPPTIYHHFGDKRALVDRVVDDCFAEFDRALARRRAPGDPVEAARWAFDRYVEYGLAHPTHYRLMFQRRAVRPTPGGIASYDRLRHGMRVIAEAGRLTVPVEEAAAAFWAAAHGITSLVMAGVLASDAPAVALLRDAILARLTRPAAARRRGRRSDHAR